MTKNQQIVEHIIVTFFQAALAYIVVLPNPTVSKTAFAGAIGAGLSAVYNLLRQSNPTIVTESKIPSTVITPSDPSADEIISPPTV